MHHHHQDETLTEVHITGNAGDPSIHHHLDHPYQEDDNPDVEQVCKPEYDTECKTVQDEKCEIRSANPPSHHPYHDHDDDLMTVTVHVEC